MCKMHVNIDLPYWLFPDHCKYPSLFLQSRTKICTVFVMYGWNMSFSFPHTNFDINLIDLKIITTFYISTAFLSVDQTAPACMQSRIQTWTCEYILNIAFKSLLLHLPPDTSYLHRRPFYRRTSQSVLMKICTRSNCHPTPRWGLCEHVCIDPFWWRCSWHVHGFSLFWHNVSAASQSCV